ncbi:MAG: hypothetical protein C0434_01170 [Xanthomonadaceae bacterium]|nr:hypothetical protein [Xanthomonadaceae bacterium]
MRRPRPEAPPDAGVIARLHAAWKKAAQTAHLAVGMPDYETYVRHRRAAHPDQAVMSYAEFFRERQDARYGSAANPRCC